MGQVCRDATISSGRRSGSAASPSWHTMQWRLRARAALHGRSRSPAPDRAMARSRDDCRARLPAPRGPTRQASRDSRRTSASHPALRVNQLRMSCTARPPASSGWTASGVFGRHHGTWRSRRARPARFLRFAFHPTGRHNRSCPTRPAPGSRSGTKGCAGRFTVPRGTPASPGPA